MVVMPQITLSIFVEGTGRDVDEHFAFQILETKLYKPATLLHGLTTSSLTKKF